MHHKLRAKYIAILEGRTMIRVFTATVFLTLLAFALPPLAAADWADDKAGRYCSEDYSISLGNYGSFENCKKTVASRYKKTRAVKEMGKAISGYTSIRDAFIGLPRAGGFVVAAEDCDDTRNIRYIMEGRIRQLQDLRRQLTESINTLLGDCDPECSCLRGRTPTALPLRQS